MRQLLDITGEKYGKLTAIKLISTNPTMWLCKCDCGTQKEIRLTDLRSGRVTSCGCAYRSQQNCSKYPEHRIWKKLQSLQISKSWEKYENFYADMGKKPKNTYLNRKNILQPYSKRNCFWGSKKQYICKYLWIIEGDTYSSAAEAGKAKGVTDQTIINWCKGYKKDGWFYAPRDNCYVEKI